MLKVMSKVSGISAKIDFTCSTCGYEFSLYAHYDGEVNCPICGNVLSEPQDDGILLIIRRGGGVLMKDCHASCNAPDSQSAHPA